MRKFSYSLVKIALLGTLAMSVAGCGTMRAIPPSPASAAQTTVLDEQGALGVELAYQAAALSLRTGLRAGLIKGEAATKARAADAKAYGAVLAARAAYDTANARDYGQALIHARTTIGAVIALAQ